MSERKQAYYDPADYVMVHKTHLKRLQRDSTYEEIDRLRAIERAARELIDANDAIAAEGPSGCQWSAPLMLRHKAALEALRLSLNDPPTGGEG